MTAAQPHRPLDDEPPDEVPAGSERSRQRAIIEHELIRVRRQAEAARLEAQASRLDASAEQLEGLLQRIDAGEPIAAAQLADLGLEEIDPPCVRSVVPQQPPAALEKTDAQVSVPDRIASGTSPGEASASQSPAAQSTDADIGIASKVSETGEAIVRFDSWEAIRAAQDSSAKQLRPDAAHASVRPPRMRRRAPAAKEQDCPSLDVAIADGPSEPDAESQPLDLPAALVLLDQANDEQAPRRRRSAAFLTSAVVHLILLIVLAGFTLSSVMPKDQVALSASTTQASEEAIQTFQIETVQPATDPAESTPDETQYDLDPLGEMAVVEVTPGEIAATSPPLSGAFSQPSSAASSSLQSLKSDSSSKMEFCGVEGGGNHFVYLVDSSGSMGDAFVSARRALLESIDMLSDEQRFYVIFFDANCDYMRITRADQDEPRSVKANQENKQRLRSWAMRVEMDRGKAPYEPLQYALGKLKPDVIFLLSDGEFPQGIEDLILKQNRVSNLFGESKPVSIIHTIGYHSREGESRMRRIAENNFGQYRHVPKP